MGPTRSASELGEQRKPLLSQCFRAADEDRERPGFDLGDAPEDWCVQKRAVRQEGRKSKRRATPTVDMWMTLLPESTPWFPSVTSRSARGSDTNTRPAFHEPQIREFAIAPAGVVFGGVAAFGADPSGHS